MLDPFPLQPPSWLTTLVEPVSTYLSLPTLTPHIHEILLSALAYHAVCVYVSPYLSTRLFPRIYPDLPPHTRVNWDVHVVSLVQSVTINLVALYVMFRDAERTAALDDWRVCMWGYTGAGGLVQALATGYFMWDLVITARYLGVFGWGLLGHAICALAVYLFGFRPILNFYAPTFILYELSSPFLNIHWFLDKLRLTGSSLQLYNGILLIATFFSSRLLWGVYNSACVFADVSRALRYQHTPEGRLYFSDAAVRGAALRAVGAPMGPGEEVLGRARPAPLPVWVGAVYLASNVVLTALNVFWFGKMIQTVRARFEPPWGTKAVEEKSGRAASDEKAGATTRGQASATPRSPSGVSGTARRLQPVGGSADAGRGALKKDGSDDSFVEVDAADVADLRRRT